LEVSSGDDRTDVAPTCVGDPDVLGYRRTPGNEVREDQGPRPDGGRGPGCVCSARQGPAVAGRGEHGRRASRHRGHSAENAPAGPRKPRGGGSYPRRHPGSKV